MREIRYFCPHCQGMELELEQSPIVSVNNPALGGRATCKLCGWQGLPDEVIGALSEENDQFWTGERIANALLLAASKHAAGPMVQVLELIGLVPRIQGSPEEQRSAEAVRAEVMRAVLEAVVTSAFEASAMHSLPHFTQFDPPMRKLSEKLFYSEGSEDAN